MPTRLPEPLIQAMHRRRCLLFVGSGLSSAAGYPSWSELVRMLVARARQVPFARTGGLDEIEREGDLITLAEFVRSALPADEIVDVLRQHLDRPILPTRAHEVIARTEYRGIVTTNYDKLLETTVTRVRQWAPSVFTHENSTSIATALYDPGFFIFKLHGDLHAPGSIVLSARDYDRLLLRSPHVRGFLHAAFLNYRLLFVGYSLRDPDFQLILRELTLIFEDFLPTNYALIPNAGEFATDHLMRRLKIQAIPYDPAGGHAEAVEILERLQAEAPADIPQAA